MKQNYIMNISTLVFVFCFSLPLAAVVISSNSSVSLQPAITFPAADTDNMMLGFAWFKNGFTLEDATTTCSFDSVYPVSGTVNLNGGTLILDQDLIFHDITTLQSLGTVIGNGHFMNFCNSVVGFPSTTNTFQDVNLFINNDFTITSSLLFQGNCIFNGNGNSLVIGENGYIVVAPGSTLQIENVTLQNVAGTNIQCADDTASIVFEEVSVVQSGDYTFSFGSMLFLNTVDWIGSYTFVYESSQTSTIASQSELSLSQGLLFFIGRHENNAAVDPLVFVDSSSILGLENCIFKVNEYGMQVTTGQIEVRRDVVIDITSTTTDSALVLGDGITEHDIFFELFPASTITFLRGMLVFDVTSLNILESRASSATVIRSAESIFTILQSIVLSNVTIKEELGAVTNVAPGQTLLFNNVTMQLPTGSVVLNGYNLDAYTNLLNGNQSLFMVSGSLPLATLVGNSGNLIGGNGSIGGPIILQDSDAQLTWALNGPLLYDMTMNGGSIILASDLTCGSNVQLTGPYTIHLGHNLFSLGQIDLTASDPIYFDGAHDGINLYSNVILDTTWTFSGQCVLDANGHTLDLDTGTIVVENGSSLTISNVILKNVSGTNIQCLDNAGVITLDNVDWQQSGDFTFGNGALRFSNAVLLQGDAVFAYQSVQTSTLLAQATLTLDSGFTFSYDSGTSPDLLVCVNNSSKIVLNNAATLHATTQGLNLTNGSMIIQGNGYFASEIQGSTDNGITFGNCYSAHDFVVTIGGNAVLEVTQGSLNYKNVSNLSFIMQSTISSIQMDDGTSLNLYQNLYGQGSTLFVDNNVLGQSPDVNFEMSTTQHGLLTNVTLPYCS
ncbi:MAG: hypothetical protein NTX86_00190 [Candidatus Dependentiae bacterium]|nr:hypothetical protein [Candidatus Dependentiae bacterium]